MTIHDAARAAGVSVSTVSKALNDNGRMAAETRTRIKQVAEDISFRPNALARKLISSIAPSRPAQQEGREWQATYCDMGEAFGRWRVGDTDDASLMPLISSANIAAGFHAGDPNLMDETVRLAAEHGVGIGAHPGYNDLQGFGRRKIAGTAKELVNDLVYQVGAIREFAHRHGVRLQHVKPHGALYMEMVVNPELSQSFVQYMRTVEPNAYIFCMGGSATFRAATEAGQPVVREFYADRDYDDSGSIVFTRDAGRPDPAAIARKVLRACQDGKVRTVTGRDIGIAFESICFHSDTLGAFDIVRQMRDALVGAGIRIAPVSALAGR